MKTSLVHSFLSLYLAAQLVYANTADSCSIGSSLEGPNAKDEQLKQFTVVDAGTQETSQFGVKINNSDSLKAGLDGPTLLEDFMLREKIMHFGKIIYIYIYILYKKRY
jgi:catalase